MTVAASVQVSFSPISISEPHNPTSSIILVKRLGFSSSYSFSSTVTVWTLFSPNCPLFHRRRLPLRQLLLKKPSSSLITKNAVYTTEGLPSSRAATTKLPTRRGEKTELERDAISILNDRIRRDHSGKKETSRPLLDSEEADRYIQLVKEQQQRGLQKLKGGGDGDRVGSFSYKVDPYTLRSGDYVVHKKVGIGRFIGIKFDLPKDSTEPIEYVFIEYADGMAKLPVKQASRVLYRYNL